MFCRRTPILSEIWSNLYTCFFLISEIYFNNFRNNKVQQRNFKENANFSEKRTHVRRESSSSDDFDVGMVVVSHALSSINSVERKEWIIDSGATCHMCNDFEIFQDLKNLGEDKHEIKVGDGYTLKAEGEGHIKLKVKGLNGFSKCKLFNVLYVPDLSYNLISVSNIIEAEMKNVKFTDQMTNP